MSSSASVVQPSTNGARIQGGRRAAAQDHQVEDLPNNKRSRGADGHLDRQRDLSAARKELCNAQRSKVQHETVLGQQCMQTRATLQQIKPLQQQ